MFVKYFEFDRKYTKQGKEVVDVIGCKIRGLRAKQDSRPAFANEELENDVRIVKIEGCEYRVPEPEIMAWIELYREPQSELVEDIYLSKENEEEGLDRTGVYSIKVKLHREIPQLLPMDGRRVKIYYKGIQKLCTRCFGEHNKRVCQSQKVRWYDYVKEFIDVNPDIESKHFGKWWDLVKKQDPISGSSRQPDEDSMTKTNITQLTSVPPAAKPQTSQETQPQPAKSTSTEPISVKPKPPPTLSEYNLPSTDEELTEMVSKLVLAGAANPAEAKSWIKTREQAFNKALREYRRDNNPPHPKNTRSRKNSLPKPAMNAD